ncbi:MAG: type IV toxin-antitoxin system AbiEi family antitoxin domain-containing protein [Candidatus Delongbacteria bacterium]|nr:type IV toxin-antitoxin system AbiEi family antitoxin domain-containing protein [Candidatus Delongbacteria bacterium]
MKNKAEKIFRKHGGQLKMTEAIRLGITRYTLYSMCEKGIVEKVARGIYRLKSMPIESEHDIISVCSRFPQAVIFLISALYFHKMTTQIPYEVYIAVPTYSRIKLPEYPPIRSHRLSEVTYQAGIEERIIDGVKIKIYNPEKTLVDCFRFRNKIGLDVAIEALKFYRQRGRMNLTKISKYAKICRVDKVMQPYLEAII